jgi:hypothetical protein
VCVFERFWRLSLGRFFRCAKMELVSAGKVV